MNVAFSSQLPPKHMRLSRNASRSMGVFPGGSVRVNLTVEDELCVHLICFPSSDIDENIIMLPDWIDKNFHVKGDQITMKVVDNSKARVAHTLQIRKVFGNVWLPPTRVLLDVRKRAMPRSKVINGWENVVTRNLGKYFLSLNAVFAVHICGELCIFKVERIEIDGLPMTKEDTVRNNAQNTQIEILPELSFTKNVPMIGGLGKEIEELRRLIDESFSNFDIHDKLNIPITRAVMISGPRGTGKSLLIQNVCQKIQAQLFEISLASVVSVVSQIRDQAEFLENNLIRWTFTKAILSEPSVIVIEGFDLLDNARGVDNDWKSLVIKIMSREMQELEKEFKVFVIGVANDLNKLPATFRNRELFQSNLTVTAPARRSREEILRIHLSKLKFGDQTEVNDFAKRLSQRTSGFVGRDLMRLCRSAALHSLRRCEKQKQDCDIADLLAKLSMSESSISDSRELVWEDFEYALGIVKPSEKIVFESSIPTRRWDEIGGYEAVKRRVHQILDWPLSHPETYEKLGIKPPAGLLLHGPSGCGKTVLVQAAATTLSANSITIKGPELFSKYLGETEAAIRRLFATAKQIAPCLIFFDEIDSITSKREWDNDGTSGVNERVLSTLLNEMDGIQERKDVLIVGCTNRPDQIDDALLRPGRLDQLLYVGLPSLDDRESIIRVISRHIPLDVDVDIKSLAARTDAFTGAELELLFRESSILALREDIGIQQVSYKHVEPVLLRVKKTVMERISTDERTLDLSVARQ